MRWNEVRGLAVVLLACMAPNVVRAAWPLVSFQPGRGFPLIADGAPVAIWLEPSAPTGLLRVAGWFADDLERLSGHRPRLAVGDQPPARECLIAGVIGQGGLVDRLIAEQRIDVASIRQQREASVICIVERPAPGVDRALVVAGSDKRGAIYGLFDLSRAAGVSPWHWWADVPAERRSDACVSGLPFVRPAPKVRYRGIFINDEAPALADWAQEKGSSAEFVGELTLLGGARGKGP
ncbi:MAG: hypothetical protein DCC67_02335 [Planctomycetota bacterium]|nr:MAG: hypothetical protein DCC67_02335 [Planctomycetota bacterium]